jgi:hypothetical protein
MTKQEKELDVASKYPLYKKHNPVVIKYGQAFIDNIIDKMMRGLGWDEILRSVNLKSSHADVNIIHQYCSKFIYLSGKNTINGKNEPYLTEQEMIDGYSFDGKLSGEELELFESRKDIDDSENEWLKIVRNYSDCNLLSISNV